FRRIQTGDGAKNRVLIPALLAVCIQVLITGGDSKTGMRAAQSLRESIDLDCFSRERLHERVPLPVRGAIRVWVDQINSARCLLWPVLQEPQKRVSHCAGSHEHRSV